MALLNDTELDITIAELQNQMAEELAKHEEPLDILLFGDNKAKHEGKLKTYQEKQSTLEKHRERIF